MNLCCLEFCTFVWGGGQGGVTVDGDGGFGSFFCVFFFLKERKKGVGLFF